MKVLKENITILKEGVTILELIDRFLALGDIIAWLVYFYLAEEGGSEGIKKRYKDIKRGYNDIRTLILLFLFILLLYWRLIMNIVIIIESFFPKTNFIIISRIQKIIILNLFYI